MGTTLPLRLELCPALTKRSSKVTVRGHQTQTALMSACGAIEHPMQKTGLLPICSLLSRSASCLCPLVSSASKTEPQVLSASPVPGSALSHLLRTSWHTSSDGPGLSLFTVSITKDSTPRWSTTCSHPSVMARTMSSSSSASMGLELKLS